MFKIILQNKQSLTPFNEPARDLRIENKPLWLVQRDVLAPYTTHEVELPPGARLPQTREACLVYRDNLYFDEFYIRAFLQEARKRSKASRAAFSIENATFREHCLPLSSSYSQMGDVYLADLWYFPNGPDPDVEPLVIDTYYTEAGFYHVPTYMAPEQGDLTFQVPRCACMAIDSWVHVHLADVVMHLFARAGRFENLLNHDLGTKLKMMGAALMEGKQLLECSQVVHIGRNCTIDPTAVLHGPTWIGDHVTIGAGAVIENCTIGSNVNISQGCQLMLSVVGDGTFLPFRASLFMTTIMENSMVAQNTCLQMCVVGRNTFVGAGSTFTDFNLLSAPIKARDASGALKASGRPVLGGCIGHNCRIGAGMIVYPARIIESDVVLISSPERRVIDRDVVYEDSDHHHLPNAKDQQRLYPRPGEKVEESW